MSTTMYDYARAGSRYAYDSAGRRITVTDALSNATWTAYDDQSRVLATWGATYPVAYEFDDFGRMAAMYTYRGTNEIASYSQLTNLQSQMDRTAWQYDLASGLLTNKVYADGKGPSYTYTADGKLLSRTWARGITTTYSYDGIGQMTNIAYGAATPGVSFTYDRLGRQVAIADGTGTRTFAYNDALQLAAETNTQGVLAYDYDSYGRSVGFDWGAGYSVRYGYEAMGRFSSVSSSVQSVSSVVNYARVDGSDLVGGWANDTGFAVTRAYEPNRDLLTQVLTSVGGNRVSQFDYVNDAVGRRVRRIDTASVTNEFGYNVRSELVGAAMGTNAYNYSYDPIGNRVTASNNAEALRYAANALNQYTNIADGVTNTPTYDDDGNMLTCGAWTFAWDAENRLILASNADTVVRNDYDYMSRRVGKAVNGAPCSFAYQGWALIGETSAAATNRYVYGLDLSGSLEGAGTIGGLLARYDAAGTAFYAYDGNGNVSDLVGANGTTVAHYEYDPYGNLTAMAGDLASANPFRFSTKYLDGETGLYYYGLRFYSPELGKWLSRDPIGERAPIDSLYAFVQNAPVDKSDYLGLKAVKTDCPADDTSNPWLDLYRKSMAKWGCPYRVECYKCGVQGLKPPMDEDAGGDAGIDGPKGSYPKKGICVVRINLDKASSPTQTLTHELTHCLQLCMGNKDKSCGMCLCREIQAYHRGQPGMSDGGLRWGAHISCSMLNACKGLTYDEEKAIMTDAFVNSCKTTGWPP